MKNLIDQIIVIIFIWFLIFGCEGRVEIYAIASFSPVFGLSGGVFLPLSDTSKNLNSGYLLTGRISMDTIFIPSTRIEITGGYGNCTGKFEKKSDLSLIPITLSILYPKKIFNSPFFINFKVGGGIIIEKLKIEHDELSNIDPVFHGGAGIEYKFLRNLGIKIEMSYKFIYQTYIEGADKNGHFIPVEIVFNYYL